MGIFESFHQKRALKAYLATEVDLPKSKRRAINNQVQEILDEVRTPQEAAAIDEAKRLLADRAYELDLPEDRPVSDIELDGKQPEQGTSIIDK
jgi:hypothetical protein